MIRNLVLLVVLAVGAWLVLREIRRFRERRTSQSASSQYPKMLACDHCGTHVPESQAIRVGPHAYCSEDHRRAAENS